MSCAVVIQNEGASAGGRRPPPSLAALPPPAELSFVSLWRRPVEQVKKREQCDGRIAARSFCHRSRHVAAHAVLRQQCSAVLYSVAQRRVRVTPR